MQNLISADALAHLEGEARDEAVRFSAWVNSFLIQLEINRVANSGGGSVRLPRGTFYVSTFNSARFPGFDGVLAEAFERFADRLPDGVAVTSLDDVKTHLDLHGRTRLLLNNGAIHLRDGVTLAGAGRDRTRLQNSAAVLARFPELFPDLGHSSVVYVATLEDGADEVRRVRNCTIRDLTVSGNLGEVSPELYEQLAVGTNNAQHGHGIRLYGCDRVRIRNVRVTHCRGDGINAVSKAGWGRDLSNKNILIEQCRLDNCARIGIEIAHLFDGVTIRNCRFTDIAHYALKFEHAHAGEDVQIVGNSFSPGRASAIGLLPDPITNRPGIPSGELKNVVVTGNDIHGEIFVTNSEDVSIEGNRLTGFPGSTQYRLRRSTGEETISEQSPRPAFWVRFGGRNIRLQDNQIVQPASQTEWGGAFHFQAVVGVQGTHGGENFHEIDRIVIADNSVSTAPSESEEVAAISVRARTRTIGGEAEQIGVTKTTIRNNKMFAPRAVVIRGTCEQTSLIGNQIMVTGSFTPIVSGLFRLSNGQAFLPVGVVSLHGNIIVAERQAIDLSGVVKTPIERNRIMLRGTSNEDELLAAIRIAFANDRSGIVARDNEIHGPCANGFLVEHVGNRVLFFEDNLITGAVGEETLIVEG